MSTDLVMYEDRRPDHQDLQSKEEKLLTISVDLRKHNYEKMLSKRIKLQQNSPFMAQKNKEVKHASRTTDTSPEIKNVNKQLGEAQLISIKPGT